SRQRPAQDFSDHLGQSADRSIPDSEAHIASSFPFSQHPQNPVDDDRRLLVQVSTAATLRSDTVIMTRRSAARCNSVKVVCGNGARIDTSTCTPRSNVKNRLIRLIRRTRRIGVVITGTVSDVMCMSRITNSVAVVCGSAARV